MTSIHLALLLCSAIILAAILSACATPAPPPGAPTAAQIAALKVELDSANVAPADYASIGLTMAAKACADWFSTQVMNAQTSQFGSSALSTLGGVAAAVGGPAGVGAAAGASTLSSILGSAQSSFGAGANPAAVYGLVERVQQAWLAAMPVPLTAADAYALVEAFAERCNLPNIQNAVSQALNAVPVTTSVAPAPAPDAGPPSPTVAPPTAPMTSRRSAMSTKRQTKATAAQPAAQPGARYDYNERALARQLQVPQVCIGSCR